MGESKLKTSGRHNVPNPGAKQSFSEYPQAYNTGGGGVILTPLGRSDENVYIRYMIMASSSYISFHDRKLHYTLTKPSLQLIQDCYRPTVRLNWSCITHKRGNLVIIKK